MVRSGKSRKKADCDDELPDVFKDMLVDATMSSPARTDDEGRTIKRRRVGGRIITKVAPDGPENMHQQQHDHIDGDDEMNNLFEEPVSKRPLVIETESEDSADSDMNWEEVDLQHQDAENQEPNSKNDETGKLDLVLGAGDGKATQTPRRIKRKPMTSVEKKLRLEIHKMHLCCLLVHVFIRNYWCDDEGVHTILRGILTKKTFSYLNPDEDKSQFQRSRSFMDGLEQASEAFRNRFKTIARGLSRPTWAESPEALARSQPPTDIDLPMQRADFRSAAQELQASRDVGAQLFCALLRSVGVDARLVCSLQTLPFGASTPAAVTPQAKYAAYYSAEQRQRHSTSEVDSDTDQEGEQRSGAKQPIGSLGGRTRFELNTGNASSSSLTKLPVQSKRPIRESKCPVYWVEAFNEAVQKWIPVDPLVTKTIAKPSKFEPPVGDRENSLTYVIAFEDDGSAHDVTRRYAKAYNAKTRRDRVESTKGGGRWWKRVMRIYQRRNHLDRDQVDEAELAKKEAAEPMPRNVQDFKDHPYYALERHLRRHEVIHPKREVGKVGAGKSGGSTILEPIYRRRDVHNVHSGDKWYRSMGREIKPGEQPLKRVPARRTREQSVDPDDEDEENAGTALYAIHQTTTYASPPVVDGRVPKNVYGNLDIYVPSMVPPGGSHIEHHETARAAKILGIDFAEAVTGFVFKGRHGTAVTKGAVIASEYREAVEEVIAAFEDERVQAEEVRRSHEALRIWKRFLAGLRIRERIEGYDIEGGRDAVQEVRYKMDEEEDKNDDEGGGFFPDQEAGGIAEPTAERSFEQQAAIDMDEVENGGFTVDETRIHDQDRERQARDPFLENLDEDGGGGFLVDDDHDEDVEQALQDVMEVNSDIQRPIPAVVPTYVPISPAEAEAVEQGDVGNGREEREIEPMSSAGGPPQEEPTANNSESGGAPSTPRFNSELTKEELEEARLLQELYESEQKRPQSHTKNEAAAAAVAHSPQYSQPDASESAIKFPEAVSEATNVALRSSISPTTEPPLVVESPKSDKGSLLSEDPEDEDAEPDWLI